MTATHTPGTPTKSPLDALLSAVLGRRVRGLSVEVREGALVLRGWTDSFHVKQLAQHTAMAVTELPLAANEIEVTRSRRAVLATDNGRVRATVRECLAASGWEVATASGGVECVARIRESNPGLVILDTDLRWGGADGVVATLAGPGRRVPVILLGERLDEWLPVSTAPVVAVLDKPVDRDDLSAAVLAASAGGRMSAG